MFWGRHPTPQAPFVGDKELAVASPRVGSLGAPGSTRGTGFRRPRLRAGCSVRVRQLGKAQAVI